jgi:RNA polymerase sigma-70 factor (ECF subfamily)
MYRSVFVLCEVEQLSTEETAECLGLSAEAVKTRLHRSRALRDELTARMGPAIAGAYACLGERSDRTVAGFECHARLIPLSSRKVGLRSEPNV